MKKLIPFVMGRYLNTMARLSPSTAGRHGFNLFCYPFRAPLSKNHTAFLDPARCEVINHEGVDVQVYRWGTGKKKILFLHGWQSHAYRWKSYVEMFSKEEYSLYAIDAPGHGYSSGKFLTVLLYGEIIKTIVNNLGEVDSIIAHSLGAFTTLYTLHHVPSLPVEKLILLAPPGEATEFFDHYQSTLRLNKAALQHIQQHFEEYTTATLDYFSASRFASSLNHPGLLIHDKEDADTSYKHSIAINQAWKSSNLILTEGLGHNLKSPDVAKKVWDFVNNVPVEMR
jgi:pimeloyl-ACP methyl ester carboxylesterase